MASLFFFVGGVEVGHENKKDRTLIMKMIDIPTAAATSHEIALKLDCQA